LNAVLNIAIHKALVNCSDIEPKQFWKCNFLLY